MNLWIGNIAPEVTDEELAAFVVKYGCPRPERIERVPGDGSRPAAVLAFDGRRRRRGIEGAAAPERHVLEGSATPRANHPQAHDEVACRRQL